MLGAMAAKRRRVGNAFGVALLAARRQKGISQEVLAGRADYSTVSISLFENGHRQPTISALISLEAALGLEPGDLVRQTVLHLKSAQTNQRARSADGISTKKHQAVG